MIYKYSNTLVANYLQEIINFMNTIQKFVKCSVVVVVVVVIVVVVVDVVVAVVAPGTKSL